MPSTYNLPKAPPTWEIEDVNRFQKLPYYLANLSAKIFPIWKTYSKFTGSVKWQQNMGTTMRGVRVEPTPVGRQMFFPNAITTTPKKDQFSQMEVYEEGLIRRHYAESKQFSFLPSFQDFRKEQIPTAMKDITQQIAIAEDFFIRSFLFHRSPFVYLPGRVKVSGSPFAEQAGLIAAPTGDGSDDGSTGKTTAFLQQCIAELSNGAKNTLSFKAMNALLQISRHDLMLPAFEGMNNGSPADNEAIKGNYVIVGSGEAYSNLSFDEHILSYKNLQMNLLNSEFAGKVLGSLIFRPERFPLRIASDGTFPVPQVYETNPSAYNYGQTIPNPSYVNAPVEVAFYLAGESCKTLDVGPAPADFAGGKMSVDRFNKLAWNGEVRLTDNVLVNLGTAASPVWDTNKYGEVVQLISATNYGAISVDRRQCIPVIYNRWRPSDNV